MRITRLFGVALLLILPAAASALQVPFVGSPFAHVTVLPIDVPSDNESQTAEVVNATNNPGINDICWNERVYEYNGKTVEQYSNSNPNFRTCEDQKVKKSDCPAKKNLVGSVTYENGFEDTQIVNRCDKQPLLASGGSSGLTVAAQKQVLDSANLGSINATTDAGKAKLIDVYQQLGVSQSTAQPMVSQFPQQSLDLLNAMQSGDQAGAAQAAQEMKLDPGVLNANTGQIDTGGQAQSGADGSAATANTSHPAQGNLPDNICGVGGVAGGMMNPESGCGASNGSGTYQGPLQYSCSTWASYANATGNSQYADCSYRNNPTIAAQVTNQYYDNIMAPKYSSQCQAAGVSVSSCMYAIHAFGEGGFQQMLASAQADPSASATAWCGGSSCNNKPILNCGDGTILGAFNGMDNLMTSGWGACKGGGSATPMVFAGSLTPTIIQNNPTNLAGQVTYTAGQHYVVASDGSFVPVSTPSISTSNGLGGLGGLGGIGGLGMGYQLGNGLGNSFGNLFTPASQTNTQQTPPPPPTLTLNVQPQSVARGASIGVAWTAGGMSGSAPCAITQNGTSIGQGNVGTATITTSTTTPPTVVVRAVCQAATNGQVYQQSVTVAVH